MDKVTDLLRRLRAVLGQGGLLTDTAARCVYARDASHFELGLPLAVALARNGGEVSEVLALCGAAGVPVVCRGTGTGLSGGALPSEGCLVLATSGMGDLGPVDVAGRCIHVGPGVLNEVVSRRARAASLEFAPDPSSQAVSTIGGNIAENAGGPHCLRHGVTLSHLRRLEWCDAGGHSWSTGRGLAVERGLDLTSLLCGSEGTLGVVTAADLALIPVGAAVRTLLAVFPLLDDAVSAVVTLVGSGLLPVAVEIVDQTMLAAVETAFAFGFPTDVEAVMIVEFSGPEAAVAADAASAQDLLATAGARAVTLAADESERTSLWRCRKKAFGAVGRVAPSYVTMDVVVPLGRLPRLVRDIQDIKTRFGVEIATAFHAGDGNLHPGIHFDDRDPEQTRRAHAAADAIIARALELDGSCTGEHGVGIEKLHVLPLMIDGVTAALQTGIKQVFDPAGLLNPGKLLTPLGIDYAAVKPVPVELRVDWESLTVTAPAALPVAEVQSALMARGLWVPIGSWLQAQDGARGLGRTGTVGELVMDLLPGPGLGAWGTVRDVILELWAETGDGRLFHAGAPVYKNVAGYSLAQALCGSGASFVRPRAATFQVRPVPTALGVWVFRHPGGSAGRRTLVPVLRTLTAHQGAFPGPVAILETDGERLQGPLVILAPGRDVPWDLTALGRRLVREADAVGCRLDYHRILDFAGSMGQLAPDGVLPPWAVAADTWTMLMARSRPGNSAAEDFPWAARRIMCQFTPRVCWSPDALVSDEFWFADVFRHRGVRTEAPAPVRSVPLDVLRGLKQLFDPQDALPQPGWLKP